jgi:hypothetical protein
MEANKPLVSLIIAVLLKSFEYWLFYFDLAGSLLDIKFECSGAINLARGVHIALLQAGQVVVLI